MFSKMSIVLLAALLGLTVGAYAADWISEDIDTQGGSTEYDEASGKWTIEGAGFDIWRTSDEFRFVYQEVSGDLEISVRVLSQENTAQWAKAGVMARSSAAADAANFFSTMSPGGGVYSQWRKIDGGPSAPPGEGPLDQVAPYYVKLVREGNMFMGFKSEKGEQWEESFCIAGGIDQPSKMEIEMNDPIVVGLAVLSAAGGGTVCEVEFDSLEASFVVSAVEPMGKLPIVWAQLKTRR